jgi:hypothetical protein
MTWHAAQADIGRLRAPVNDPLIADFVAALDRINALADLAPGLWLDRRIQPARRALHVTARVV